MDTLTGFENIALSLSINNVAGEKIRDKVLDMMTETIIKATEYWLKEGCQETPETIVGYIKKLSDCR